MAYCSNCGTKLNDGVKFCPECGHTVGNKTADSSHARVSIPESGTAEGVNVNKRNVCKKCGGTVKYETVTEEQSRKIGCLGVGCLVILGLVMLFMFRLLIGIAVIVVCVLIFSLSSKNDKVAVTYAVCQNCGYREKVSN